jgi:UDP-glucose-4-epimerase GalE
LRNQAIRKSGCDRADIALMPLHRTGSLVALGVLHDQIFEEFTSRLPNGRAIKISGAVDYPSGRCLHTVAMSDRPVILVTGGAGYIGSHACRALEAAGYHVVVYDNLSTGNRDFVAGPLVVADLLDRAALSEVFAQYRIAGVMHFAAASLVGESMADPQKYFLNNVGGTLSLLSAMRETGCDRLVFSSSGAVYGQADSMALTESQPCAPINTYGTTKWMIERILADYRSAYGFGAFCLRYFNASGADVAGDLGELRDNETHLIPRAMMAMQGHLTEFAVFGTDYDTPDGTAIRDYVHVTDLATAHVAALRLLLQGHKGGAFNLGTGVGFSVHEILAAIAAETGRQVPHTIKPRRSGDPAYLVADPSASRNVLKFAPRYSDLPTIIRTAWAWHRKARPLKAISGPSLACSNAGYDQIGERIRA